MDDIFGGFKGCKSYDRALHFRTFLCSIGKFLTLKFNMKTKKTPLPARQLVILGRLWNSDLRLVRTAPSKISKYISRIYSALTQRFVSRKDLEKIHGNLNYVASIEPYGRPFLTFITEAFHQRSYKEKFLLPESARLGLALWWRILVRNRGCHLNFILNELPRAEYNIFVDASTS